MGRVTALPRGRSLTVADLDRMPDDGHRYELIDGALIVTPAPSVRHQIMVAGLLRLLADVCPAELRVLTAPVDVILADDTSVQPDLVVARRSDFAEQNLPTAPLLAAEVLSASTRSIDLSVKRERYCHAGVPSYWVLDPDELRLTAWELRAGEYAVAAEVSGSDSWTATIPYPVPLIPGRLID